MICKRFQVFGRVQGVGFRYATRQVANKFGLKGWCRNLSDSSVEVCVWGDQTEIGQLQSWLSTGPPAAIVERVENYLLEMDDYPNGFEVR